MIRKLAVASALVCVLVPVFTGTASAGKVVPWITLARSANVACLSYDNKLFKLPGLAALKNVKSEKDITPTLMKSAMVPYLTGELALEKDLVRKWSALGTPKEPAYRVAWARWLTLWKTVHIPSAAAVLASAKRDDVKGMEAAQATLTAHDAEGNKLEKKTLAFAVCQWNTNN
jgi:hypothetical protein